MTTTLNTVSARIAAFEAAMVSARQHLSAADPGTAFALLERAHVLGQRDLKRHFSVHLRMLQASWMKRDAREMVGQIMRIALVPLGHLVGRLPRGNTGGANVSAFAPMPIAAEIERLLGDDHTAARKQGRC